VLDPSNTVNLINTGGIVALLVINIFAVLGGLMAKKWVPGWLYSDLEATNEKLKLTVEGYEANFKSIIALLEAEKVYHEQDKAVREDVRTTREDTRAVREDVRATKDDVRSTREDVRRVLDLIGPIADDRRRPRT
jgi:hypothetical protein